MEDDASLEELRTRWISERDGESGHAYGEALERSGRIAEAADIFEQLTQDSYLVGFADLAWLEHGRGNTARAQELMERYIELDDDPDDQTSLVRGVLGHWLWHSDRRDEAEPLLRDGADHYPEARADLAHLLRSSSRDEEAESVLRRGVLKGEVMSYLPLANLLDESGHSEEAEQLYRYGFSLGDAFSAYNLHLMLRRQGRVDEAMQWLWHAAEGRDEKAITLLAEADPT